MLHYSCMLYYYCFVLDRLIIAIKIIHLYHWEKKYVSLSRNTHFIEFILAVYLRWSFKNTFEILTEAKKWIPSNKLIRKFNICEIWWVIIIFIWCYQLSFLILAFIKCRLLKKTLCLILWITLLGLNVNH